MLDLIGRYQVQEKIGEGAMADVYRAYDPSIRRPLAIKILKPQYGQDQEYASRFLREAKAAGALSHPNIVTIYDVGEVDGHPYIVMELLEGEPLNELMAREGPLGPSRVLTIAQQLADALSYAHPLGVVHRDIKPSNIMVAPSQDAVKILDFGIARVNEAERLLEADHLKTRIGQILGTPRYMSPEQALGEEIDGRSDLFSVGVVMYEMLTGKKAFGGASAATLALQITQEDPEPIANSAPATPRGLQFIVTKLLAKKPDRRFANGRALAEALRRERASHETSEAEAESKRLLPLQVRITAVMAVITAAVLALTVGAVVMRQDDVMRRMAVTTGAAMTSFVASNASLKAVDNAGLPPDKQDWLPVQAFVQAASADKNVLDVKVVDVSGVIRAASDPALVGKPDAPPPHEASDFVKDGMTVASIKDGRGRQGFRFVDPITYAGRSFGQVDLSLSKSELSAASTLTRGLMAMLSVIVLGVVVAATYVASRALARPLKRLKQALDDAASGDFNFRISHNRTDEFGELFDAFNRLSASMHDRLDSIEAIALDQDGPAVATDALASTQTSIKPPAKDLQNSVFSPPLNFQRTPPPPSVEERSEAARSDEAGSVPKPVETHVEATAIDAATIEAAPMETPRAEPPSQEPQSLAPLSLEALTSEALSSEALSSEALSSEALSSEAATLEPPSQEPSRIEPTKVDASQALQTAAPAPSPFTPAPMEASSTDLGAAGPAPSSAGKPIRRRRPKVVPETRPELTAPPPVPAQAAAPASPKTHDDDRTVIDVLQDAQRKS